MKNKDLTRFLVILVALVVGIGVRAHAEVNPDAPINANNQHLLEQHQAAHLEGALPAFTSDLRATINAIEKASREELKTQGVLRKCDAEYSTVLDQRDNTDNIYIFIGFGYWNGKLSITEDLTLFRLFRQQLLKDCSGAVIKRPSNPQEKALETPPLHQLCGFKEVDPVFQKEDRALLRKTITLSSGEEKQVLMDVRTSSISEYDNKNRTENSVEQEAKSKETEAAFRSALGSSNVVMYVGHSRDGGGPDFRIPMLKPKYSNTEIIEEKRDDEETVNYRYYDTHTTQRDEMVTALKNPKVMVPGLVGIFSCKSAEHFIDYLVGPLAGSRLLMTTKVTERAFSTFLVSLNGVLSLQCESELNQLLQHFDGVSLYPR